MNYTPQMSLLMVSGSSFYANGGVLAKTCVLRHQVSKLMRPSSRLAFPVSGWDSSECVAPRSHHSMLAVAAEGIVPVVKDTAAEADTHPAFAAAGTGPELGSHLGSGWWHWCCTVYPASLLETLAGRRLQDGQRGLWRELWS